MSDIADIINGLNISDKVKADALAVYGLIAEAESKAHGKPITDIHFHEVGTMDAVADIVGVCVLLEQINPDRIVVSPIATGFGQVRCAHGILPVPAPATAYILKDIPVYGGKIEGELCTPTGAALLKYYADRFGDMPVMKVKAIGYGMGKKDFDAANTVRALLGDTEDKTEGIIELSCNVDDMTAEEIAYAVNMLFEEGANEAFTVPVGMKKSRPGTLIRVICKEKSKEKMVNTLFKYTTTLGVREVKTDRYVLDRKIETVDTAYGKVRRKVSSGYGVTRVKYEYDDVARIAKENGLGIDEVRKSLDDIG
jgi:hypothetical protein